MFVKYATLKTGNFKAPLKKTMQFSNFTEQPWLPRFLEPKGKIVPFSISLNNWLYDVGQNVFFSFLK